MTKPFLPWTDPIGFFNDQARQLDRLQRLPRVRPNNRSSFGTETPTSIYDAARILSGVQPASASGISAGLWSLSTSGGTFTAGIEYHFGSHSQIIQSGSIDDYVSVTSTGFSVLRSAHFGIRLTTLWAIGGSDYWSGQQLLEISGATYGNTHTIGPTVAGPNDFTTYAPAVLSTSLLGIYTVGVGGDTVDISTICYGTCVPTACDGWLTIEVIADY